MSDNKYLQEIRNQSISPIFILGDHRSGTTLLYELLALTKSFNFLSAYHVIKYNELLTNFIEGREQKARQRLQKKFLDLNIENRTFDNVSSTIDSPEEYGFILLNLNFDTHLSSENIDVFMEICKKIQYIQNENKPLLLKNPWDFKNFMYIKSIFTDAKFIFIHRHPIHIINSKLKAIRLMLSNRGEYSLQLSRRYQTIFNQPLRRLFYQFIYSDFLNVGLIRVSQSTVQATTYFIDNINHLNETDYIFTTYENLCNNPQLEISKILNFLDLSLSNFIQYDNLVKPRPLNLLPEVRKKHNKLIQDLRPYLDYLGYD